MKNVHEMYYGIAYFTFRLLLYDIRQYEWFSDTQYMLVSVATFSILTASTDDAVHRTGSLFDSAEKSECRIPTPFAPREKFLHERRQNRDKQRTISAAIHFRAKERQTNRKYFSMSTLDAHRGKWLSRHPVKLV